MLSVNEKDIFTVNESPEWIRRVYEGETVMISGEDDQKAVAIPFKVFEEFKRMKAEKNYWDEINRRVEEVKNGAPLIRKTMEELEAMEDE